MGFLFGVLSEEVAAVGWWLRWKLSLLVCEPWSMHGGRIWPRAVEACCQGGPQAQDSESDARAVSLLGINARRHLTALDP